ncbi:DUF488 domain-containing protein [Pleomorphomonas koreensis]|uniref:DUF488 domain-containing protein n=1 Tax=Pleomorphomonas koreensis TaxID=257440 RepID=UPI0004101519|nr:DUF488 domain-containing protein [Pleomorphomonas koreensis]
MDIRLKRVYVPPAPDDGRRVLVDRLWPRGLRKADAAIDVWLKEITPSIELRTWFGHDPVRLDEFARRYEAELDGNEEAVRRLDALLDEGRVTLLYAARDPHCNHAQVLAAYMARRRLPDSEPDDADGRSSQRGAKE